VTLDGGGELGQHGDFDAEFAARGWASVRMSGGCEADCSSFSTSASRLARASLAAASARSGAVCWFWPESWASRAASSVIAGTMGLRRVNGC
jgi:hypothetical protein